MTSSSNGCLNKSTMQCIRHQPDHQQQQQQQQRLSE